MDIKNRKLRKMAGSLYSISSKLTGCSVNNDKLQSS